MPTRHVLLPLLTILPGVISCSTGPASPPAATRAWADALPGHRRTWSQMVRAVKAESDSLKAEVTSGQNESHFRSFVIDEPTRTLGGVRMVVVHRLDEYGCTGNMSCDQYFETSAGWAGPFRTCGLDANRGPEAILNDGTPVWLDGRHEGGCQYSNAYLVLDWQGKWQCLARWSYWTEGEGHDFHFFGGAALTGAEPTPVFLQFVSHPITQGWLRQQDFLTQWCCLHLEPSGKRLMAAVEYERNVPAQEKPASVRARLWSYDPAAGYVLLEEHRITSADAEQWTDRLIESDNDTRRMTEADWAWLAGRALKDRD